ncbi:MAG: Stf0 family sulfotransferase [Xenococcus sp. (in: cyanobacteria)]
MLHNQQNEAPLVYFIAMEVRSGSNLMCQYLSNNGFGNAGEYFQNINSEQLSPIICKNLDLDPEKVEPYVFFERLLKKHSSNGIFGSKFTIYQYIFMLSKYEELSQQQKQSLFKISNVKWIWLRRRDKLSQAISLFRAINSDQWVSFEEPKERKIPEYDRSQIDENLAMLLRSDFLWELFFNTHSLRPYSVFYEDFIKSPASIISEITKHICAETDKKPIAKPEDVILSSKYEVQRDEHSKKFRDMFVHNSYYWWKK